MRSSTRRLRAEWIWLIRSLRRANRAWHCASSACNVSPAATSWSWAAVSWRLASGWKSRCSARTCLAEIGFQLLLARGKIADIFFQRVQQAEHFIDAGQAIHNRSLLFSTIHPVFPRSTPCGSRWRPAPPGTGAQIPRFWRRASNSSSPPSGAEFRASSPTIRPLLPLKFIGCLRRLRRGAAAPRPGRLPAPGSPGQDKRRPGPFQRTETRATAPSA